MTTLRNTYTIFRRELKSYFESPVAYVFMIVFLLLASFLTFSVSKLYERNQADLFWFFFWHPWVFLLLVPAATMGLWAEERETGTIELLLTLPITMMQAIVGKFLAAWAFIIIGILLTLPVVVTSYWLGAPDGGVIVSGYLASILMAGAFVSVGMLTSSMTRNQVISFVLALTVCLLLIMAGWEPVTSFFVKWIGNARVVDAVASLSVIPHFDSIRRGVIDLRDVYYFVGVMVFMIFGTHLVLDNRKSA